MNRAVVKLLKDALPPLIIHPSIDFTHLIL